MREGLIHLDSKLGKLIGLTSANFQTAIVWDCRPKALYFTTLYPRRPEDKIINELFNALDNIHTPCYFVGPSSLIKSVALKHGYEWGMEPCGTDYVHNLNTKKSLKQ